MAGGAPLPMAGGPAAREVIALFGPTGVGKTDVAIALADLLRVRKERPVAISADALQVYAGLETLTGAATATEQARLEHRLLSFVPVTQEYSVGEFMPRAHAEIDAALEAGRRPIVVGGTGLYLRAALTDLDLRPPPPPELRERIEAELATRGSEAMHARLRERAPAAAATIEPTDRSRIVRALELAEMGDEGEPGGVAEPGGAAGEPAGVAEPGGAAGEPRGVAEPALADAPGASQLWAAGTRRPTLLFGLTMEREELYRRIDRRVEAIVAAGAANEVRRAEAAGASRTARKALGFDELLAGDVEAMKRRTRNYAKRQLTWMRKLAGARLVDTTGRDPLETAAVIARELD
jgi:tRNA dimethylallyltransferase